MFNTSYYILLSTDISCYRYMRLFRDFGGETKNLQTAKQCGDSLGSFRITTFIVRRDEIP